MQDKPDILRQADNEERRIQFIKRRNMDVNLSRSDMLKIILPNYDQTNQNGKPVDFHNAPQSTKVAKGGVRAAKTYTVEAESILLAYLNRPDWHISMSTTFDNARDTVVKTLIDICQADNLDFDFIASTQFFYIMFGDSRKDIATIKLLGADQSFKGITGASGDVNEAFSIPYDKILVWWERISKDKGFLTRLLQGTAEPDKMQWGYEYFDKIKIVTPQLYADTFPTSGNKYLTAQYIADLREKYDERMQKVYLDGGYINLTAGKAYHSFDMLRNVKPLEDMMPLLEKQPLREIILSFDFNVDPMTASKWELLRNGNDSIQGVQNDEYKVHSSNTDELCTLIIGRLIQDYPGIIDEPGRRAPYSLVITGDASGRARKTSAYGKTDWSIIKSRFEQAGFRFTLSVPRENPPHRDRVNDVNKMFEVEQAVICNNCVHSIKDRQFAVWKQGTAGFILHKTKDTMHLADNGDYALAVIRRLIKARLAQDGGNGFYTEGRRETTQL